MTTTHYSVVYSQDVHPHSLDFKKSSARRPVDALEILVFSLSFPVGKMTRKEKQKADEKRQNT